MLRFVRIGAWGVITAVAAIVCCFEFAGVQFWLLEPREEGFVGMGILIMMLFLPSAVTLVPVSLFWQKQQLRLNPDSEAWWKRSLGILFVSAFVLTTLARVHLVPVKPIRILGWVLSWSLILFELLPLRKRLWGVL